jgi:hypothetical protein
MNLELHVFTNSTINAPDTKIISQTYQSFQNIFGKNILPTVWCDPNPNISQAHQYILNLREIFPTVRLSQSLSDGYIKAINKSRAEYLFMLEHDWEFLPSITHTLEEVGAEFNVTRERIRQIEVKALEKIREHINLITFIFNVSIFRNNENQRV